MIPERTERLRKQQNRFLPYGRDISVATCDNVAEKSVEIESDHTDKSSHSRVLEECSGTVDNNSRSSDSIRSNSTLENECCLGEKINSRNHGQILSNDEDYVPGSPEEFSNQSEGDSVYFEDASATSDNSDYSHDDDSSNYSSSADETTFNFNADRVEGNRIMFPAAELPISDALLMVSTLSAKNRFTKEAQQEVVDLVKVLAGPQFKSWNASNYHLAKMCDPPRDKMIMHFLCDQCQELLISLPQSENTQPTITVTCEHCQEEKFINRDTSNQFMSLDIEYQLKLILNEPHVQEDLFNTLETIENRPDDGVIRDIFDGELYKNMQKHHPRTLTLNIATDGAPLYKSSSRSFWPIQLYINELSTNIRFRAIVLAGLYLTTREPKSHFMDVYFSVFHQQLQRLQSHGITFVRHSTGEEYNFKFNSLLICMDSVARPVAQNRMQYNAYSGCSWCYERGEWIEGSMRYLLSEHLPEHRSHESHVRDVREALKTGRVANGVRGSSVFSEVPLCDLVWSFPPDYLHGILLGVVKMLWEKWATSHSLNATDRRNIDQRYLQIRRPQEIHRLTRTMQQIKKFKGSEFESWLLYDALPCLEDILDEDKLASFCLLVDSIGRLLGTHITPEDIQQCNIQLLQFFADCQRFYGPTAMTFNMHMVLHLAEAVIQGGPLWCYSTFPFENGIFRIKQHISSPANVMQQIAVKHLKRKILKSNIEHNSRTPECQEFCENLWEQKSLKRCITTDNGLTLIGAGVRNKKISQSLAQYLDCPESPVTCYKRSNFKGMILRSIEYTRPQKTDDTMVKLRNGQFFQIHHFIESNQTGYVHGQIISATQYQCNEVIVHHLWNVSSLEGPEMIIHPDEIQEKLIHITIDGKNYLGCLRNSGVIQ